MKKIIFYLLIGIFALSTFFSSPVLSQDNPDSSLNSRFNLKLIDFPDGDLFSSSSGEKTTSPLLPGNFNLTVKGRKVIGIKYTRFNYFSPQTREKKPASKIDVEQKLQIRAKGKIGDKISVNVNYDDTAPRTQQQRINLVYRGDKDEIIQEVALGDIRLVLPKTEFTSYDKSLFGARLKAKWKDFYLTGIGSVTRGISETKTFTGTTTTKEKNIPDTGFLKRVYFKVFFDQEYPPDVSGNPPFSYTPGSVEVWIDDQDGSNNQAASEMTVQPVSGDSPYTGYFDLQYPGQDYTVNYPEGVIKFNKDIGEDYVIAIAYKDANGERHPSSGYYRMIMKGQDERYYRYRFMNYYYLGSQKISQDGFIFQIRDLAGNVVYDWENPEEYPDYKVNIDFDFGIAQIINPSLPVSDDSYYRPFPDAYPPTSLHRYTIYTSYTYSVDAYLLHPDMVPGSEEVYVNGRLLVKDKDYVIDYSSGYLYFLDPTLIGPDTKIRVNYEWMPIMGGEATFIGGRVEYTPSKSFSLGSTFLSQKAALTTKVPFLGFTPPSHEVWEADLHLNLEHNFKFLKGKDFPLKLFLTAEVSHSDINPNTFGRAMVENFSFTKLEDNLSLKKDSWKLGSIPPNVDPDLRDKVTISDGEIEADKVDPLWSSNKITTLNLGFDFTDGSNWDSVVYPLSHTGKDYSGMKYLEVWTKEIPSDVEVYIDIGVVSEDVDGDGTLDTEDANKDDILNPGEDTGILIGDRPIGKDNGELDTEDLDGDGTLDTEENFSTYLLSDEYRQEVSPGWYKYTIPLDLAVNWSQVSPLVKHIRLWVKSSSGGVVTLQFARISISGDRWEVHSLEIKVVNNYDDPEFNPFADPDFRNYYKNMYGSTKTSEGKWQKESALSLSGETGYIQQTFLSPKDFSDYRKVNFWIYTQEPGEGNFYLRFGSDVDVDYYQITLPLSSQTGWREVSVPFSELEINGSPDFSKIKQIRIGITGALSPTHVYINDIYLSEVYKKSGQAQRYLIKANFSKYLTLSAGYKEITPHFSVIGSSSTNNKLEVKSWSAKLSLFNFLPISYSQSDQFTSTLTTNGVNLASTEANKVSKISRNYQLAFYLPSWPKLVFKGSNVRSNYLSKEPLEKTTEDTYDLSLTYPLPLRFFLLPTSISSSLQLKKSGKEVQGASKTLDITRKGSINLPFRLARNMILTTSYSQSETDQKNREGVKMPKSRSKQISLQSRISIFGLNPNAKFKGGYKEEDFSSLNPKQRKVSTHLQLSYNLPFRPSSFLKKLPPLFSNLTYYTSFGLKREGIFEDTTASLDFLSQFGLKRLSLPDGWEKLWVEKKSFSLKQRWRPFSFIDTTISYGREEEEKTESGTPFITEVENWPSMEFWFDLNRTPFLVDRLSRRLFSSSNFVFGYLRKRTIKKGISTTFTYQPSLSWRGRFKKARNLSLTYSYKSSTQYEKLASQLSSSKEFSSTHKLKMDYLTYLPWGMRIPFLNRIINFKNQVVLSATLTRELKYKKAASGTLQEDKEKWILDTDISYKLRKNVNMKLGVDATYYKDRVKAGEDYFSYGGSVQMEIVF